MDYEIAEQFVAEDWTFELFNAEVKSGGALFELGPIVLAAINHSGWGLGMGRRALDEIKDIVNAGRTRMGSTPLREQQVFQREFGRHTLALEAAEALTRRTFAAAVDQVGQGQPLSEELANRCRACASFITQIAESAMTFAYQQAGSGVMRNPSNLQRCRRDLMVGARHLFVDEKNYEDLAKNRLAQSA